MAIKLIPARCRRSTPKYIARWLICHPLEQNVVNQMKIEPDIENDSCNKQFNPAVYQIKRVFFAVCNKYPITTIKTGAAGTPPRNNDILPIRLSYKSCWAKSSIRCTCIINITASPFNKSGASYPFDNCHLFQIIRYSLKLFESLFSFILPDNVSVSIIVNQ